MSLNTEASAALVYLILYALLFVLLFFGYLSGRLSLRSRYSIILFHVTIRLASQSTGVAFGIVGWKNYHILIAYFVLGSKWP
jgi:cytochrome b561